MKKSSVFTSLLILFAMTGVLLADGMVVHYRPPHQPAPPRPVLINDAFTVEYHVVSVNIEGQHAETFIDQKIKNVSGGLAQAQYMFPIPRNANISQFSMFIGEMEHKGEMLDADQARQIYQDYVRRVIDPALLEYVGTGLYKTSVFPFQKDEAKRLRLKYKELLTQEEGLVRYLYPLNTEKFSKYPLKRCRVEVNITSEKPIVNLYSPTHKVTINRIDAKRVQVVYEATEVKPHEDFEIFYSVEEGKFAANVLSYQPVDEAAGYFCAMIAPNTTTEVKQTPKDIVTVIDISGSMQDDRKIIQAKDALTHITKNLNPDDRFNIIAFSDFINPFATELLPYNDKNKADALAFIARLRAEGGTNIEGALETALKMYSDEKSDRTKILIFMTDGKPTVAERDPAKISKKIKSLNETKNVKLFSFAIGDLIDTNLLDWLSTQNHGFTEYIRSGESINERVTSFYNKVRNPVLTDVSLSCEGVRIESVLPTMLPDIFSGTQLVVVGKYILEAPSKIEATMKLKGKLVGEPYERIIKVKFVGQTPEAKHTERVWIEHLWASRRIGSMLNQIRLHGISDELKKEIIRLSKKYGIPTPYTSFLVRENLDMTRRKEIEGRGFREFNDNVPHSEGKGAVDDADESNKLEKSERPQGWGDSHGGGSGRTNGTPSEKYRSDKKLKDEDIPKASGNPKTKIINIGTKTFYLDNKQWVDSTINEDDKNVVKVKLFSDEFFELLKKHSELNKFVARGAIKVKLGKTVYNFHN